METRGEKLDDSLFMSFFLLLLPSCRGEEQRKSERREEREKKIRRKMKKDCVSRKLWLVIQIRERRMRVTMFLSFFLSLFLSFSLSSSLTKEYSLYFSLLQFYSFKQCHCSIVGGFVRLGSLFSVSFLHLSKKERRKEEKRKKKREREKKRLIIVFSDLTLSQLKFLIQVLSKNFIISPSNFFSSFFLSFFIFRLSFIRLSL